MALKRRLTILDCDTEAKAMENTAVKVAFASTDMAQRHELVRGCHSPDVLGESHLGRKIEKGWLVFHGCTSLPGWLSNSMQSKCFAGV